MSKERYNSNWVHRAHSIHIGENITPTDSEVSQSTNLPSSEFIDRQTQNNPPNAVNPPRIHQRERIQVSGFDAGNIGNSQSVSNLPSDQFASTNYSTTIPTILGVRVVCNVRSILNLPTNRWVVANVGENSHSRDAISQPQLTSANFQTAIEAIFLKALEEISEDNLEKAIKYGGVRTLEELAYLTDMNGNTLLAHAAQHGYAKPIKRLLSNVLDPQQLAQMKNYNEQTALLLAAQHGCADAITAMLEGVSNPLQLAEQIDNFGNSVLINAVISDASISVITKLLDSVADAEKLIFHQNFAGLNSFTYALTIENMEAALLLFDKVKDKTALLFEKNNPDQPAAIQMMKPEIQDVFLKKYNEPNH
jgi:ankyrin repeat protein